PGFGCQRRQHGDQREPRRDQQLRQRRAGADGPDPVGTAWPGARPAPHQRPPGRQSCALPAWARDTEGVRTMKGPGTEDRGRGVRRWLGALSLVAVLGGCSMLAGPKETVTIYAPLVQAAADPAWPQADWQLSIGQPNASRMIDSLRIAVRPTPGEMQVYKNAAWARRPGEQLQDALLQVLEDSGRIASVVRQGSGIAADYRLELDLRRVEADYAGGATPAATIEVNAKLVHAGDRAVVASQTFLQAVPAAGTDTAVVAEAFGQGLGTIAGEIAGWTLRSGTAHEEAENAP